MGIFIAAKKNYYYNANNYYADYAIIKNFINRLFFCLLGEYSKNFNYAKKWPQLSVKDVVGI